MVMPLYYARLYFFVAGLPRLPLGVITSDTFAAVFRFSAMVAGLRFPALTACLVLTSGFALPLGFTAFVMVLASDMNCLSPESAKISDAIWRSNQNFGSLSKKSANFRAVGTEIFALP